MGGRRNGARDNRRSVVTGDDKSANFGANEVLFVANVRKDIDETTISDYLKRRKLEIVSIEKVSHKEARNGSFKVEIKLEDKERALSAEIWPYGVKVRMYRHYRYKGDNKDSNRGGQFDG